MSVQRPSSSLIAISCRADKQMAENLAQDMADLMHDFEVVSRMNSMIGSLKCSYPGICSEAMTDVMDQIQKSIRQKVTATEK